MGDEEHAPRIGGPLGQPAGVAVEHVRQHLEPLGVEALMQLATAGLVELQPRRGAFVAALSLKDVIERFEVMAALEGACGALAARRIT